MEEEKNIIKGFKFDAAELPKVIESRSKEYVLFDLDNLYPEKLTTLYNSSAMHQTAIDSTVWAIKGEGFIDHGSTVVNGNGETLDEIFAKVVLDNQIYGAYSLNIIWNRGGDRIVEIYHIPVKKIRSGKMNEEDRVEEYWFSSDWTRYRKYKPQRYAAYNESENRGDNANQILYVKNYNPESDYYGLPEYVAAVNDVELDARISRFHNANISNGLAPSMAIKFRNGIPTPEQRKVIYDEITDTFSGESNAGRFFLLFSEPGREAQIEPIESANDTYYTTLEERVTSRILTAHHITSPMLLGIRDGSGLGSNKDEILTAYSHFFGTVAYPIQKRLVAKFNWLTTKMGFEWDVLEIEQSRIVLNMTEDIEETSDENTEETQTQNNPE